MFTVLADNNVLTSVKELIESQKVPAYFRKSSFAQLIELIVLTDAIYVDDMSFRISKIGNFLASFNVELVKVITGLQISDSDRAHAVSFAHQVNTSIAYQFSDEWEELQQLRGSFYLFLANCHDLPYFPIEQRAAFLSPLEMGTNCLAAFRKVFEIYEKSRFEAYEELKAKGIIRNYYRQLPYPPIFYYILARAANLFELFDLALVLRDSKNATSFRKWCADLVEAERNEDLVTARRMFVEAENSIKKICTEESTGYRAELQLSFPPTLTLTDLTISFKHKRHLLFLKQILSNQRHRQMEHKLDELLQLG